MLLEKLTEYAERQGAAPPAMYQEQPVRYLIDLDADGRMFGPPVDTADPKNKATQRGVRILAPHVKRTVGVRAKLLADTAEYALGLPRPDAKPDRVRQQHDAFVTLVDDCAAATGEPSVRAVAAFLAALDPAALPLPSDFDPGATLTFEVDGVRPIDLPGVRAYWARVQGADEADGAEAGTGAEIAGRMACLVCKRVRPVLSRHPLKIKGIPGGQMSGTDLISANARAFESYGLANSLIAPICQECAEKYGNGLNALLVDPETHLRVGGMVHAFWTAQETGFRPGRLFREPEAHVGEVRQLVASWRQGTVAATELDATAFYAVPLSASGGRSVVRDWIDTTVSEAQRRLGRYFALMDLVAYDGTPGAPFPLYRLVGATVRDPRKETPPATVGSALLGLALGGTPLPLDLLFQAVRRIRAEGEVNRERATLIKMVLGSQPGTTQEGSDAMRELDLSNTEPAYLCGRLLAILDAVQREALRTTNATVIDKFYGTASSAPGSVFGTLLHNAQNHLAKLRKERPTVQRALERRLEEVLAGLDGFPRTLTLPQQGLFALGYYHQRAADRRAIAERRAAKEAGRLDPNAADAGLAEAMEPDAVVTDDAA